MASDFVVRPVRPEDLDRILEIERACFRKDAYDRNLFAAYARTCGDLFLTARRHGRICGYILTCRRKADAELVSVAVEPQARRAGAASALMESTLRSLKRYRIRRFILMVRTTNWRAQRFYRKFGFTKVRVAPGYYGEGRDGLLMQRSILPAPESPRPPRPA